MKVTPEHNDRIANMTFASVYPHYITKVKRKVRTLQELHKVIEWLTGLMTRKYRNWWMKKQALKLFSKKQN